MATYLKCVLGTMDKIKAVIDSDIDKWAHIRNLHGSNVFKSRDISALFSSNIESSAWIQDHVLGSLRQGFISYVDRIDRGYYRALDVPIIKNKTWLSGELLPEVKKRLRGTEIIGKIISASIDYHENKKESAVQVRKISELAPTETIMYRHEPMLDVFKHQFKRLSNSEKAEFVTMLVPTLDTATILAKFNAINPVYQMPKIQKGDTIFHPIVGKKEVVNADEKWIYFYGNGSQWKCDRDGFIDGDKSKPRTVWISFQDYAKEMGE